MKYFVFIFLISHLSFLISAKAVEAHVLKSDGSIGAILHVSPDDDPIAGISTDFFFELKDKNGTFVPENCNCIATVFQNGQTVYTQPLFQNNDSPSLEDASFSYVLPEKDVYAIQISGEPNVDGAFEPFTLAWDIRVAREENEAISTENNASDVTPYIVVLAVVLIAVGAILGKKKRAKQPK